MSSLRLRASLALILAAFTAACGDSGSTGPSFADSVSTGDAIAAADGSADAATYLAENLNFGEPSIGASAAMYARLQARPELAAVRARMTRFDGFGATLPSWQVALRPAGLQLADGCTVSSHGLEGFPDGPPVDANENGIPDDAAMDIVCTYTEETGGDTVWTLTEEQHVAIKEIAGSLHGMTMHWEISEWWRDNHGNYEGGQITQNARIDVRSGSASTDQSMEYKTGYRWDTETAEQAVGEEWGADFDPTGTITLGNDLPDGALTLDGRRYFYDEPGGGSASFEISTPTALAYNAACAAVPTLPPFTAGVLLGELNGSSSQASFEVTFTSCGNYTIDVDGAYDEPVVVTAGR